MSTDKEKIPSTKELLDIWFSNWKNEANGSLDSERAMEAVRRRISQAQEQPPASSEKQPDSETCSRCGEVLKLPRAFPVHVCLSKSEQRASQKEVVSEKRMPTDEELASVAKEAFVKFCCGCPINPNDQWLFIARAIREAICGVSHFCPQDKATQDQIKAVMLIAGTEDQKKEAIESLRQKEEAPIAPAWHHIATEEERHCLPKGSMWLCTTEDVWHKSRYIGMEAIEGRIYACPDAPVEGNREQQERQFQAFMLKCAADYKELTGKDYPLIPRGWKPLHHGGEIFLAKAEDGE